MTTNKANPQLVRILVEDLGISEDDLRPDASLNDTGLDSLALAELAELLPERLGVHLGDDVLNKAPTVGALNTLVEQQLAAQEQQ
ncbi:acyl carrier protein [Streptomyces europaeiscabiei]|uniref:acyl carrier protein n=1 Tax=Streptomyces europaeiscabiei TaxID=146819 RepID=UPI0029ADCB7A|nr:acyl carrier protein [Streptomyces europaeiscabiei]MDX3697805.1 acyl carrier protein [Streptomyces europaeiscabiei]